MDADDGNPDVELNGDELDGNGGEDDFVSWGVGISGYGGPGCPISDPGEDEHDQEDDRDSNC